MSFTVAAIALCSSPVCASFHGRNAQYAGLASFCRGEGIGAPEKLLGSIGPTMVEPPVAFRP